MMWRLAGRLEKRDVGLWLYCRSLSRLSAAAT
jgi:hypothetical protein